MAYQLALVLCLVSVMHSAFAQSGPVSVKLTELIKSPEKYDHQLLKVEGFLTIKQEKPGGFTASFLYLNRDDAEHFPPLNSILVVANSIMLRQRANIEHKYVSLTGSFRAAYG